MPVAQAWSRRLSLYMGFLFTISHLLVVALAACHARGLNISVVEATINGVSRDPKSIRLQPAPPHSRGTGATLGGFADTSHSPDDVLSKPAVSVKRTNPIRYTGGWCGASQKTTTSNKFTGISSFFQAPVLSARKNTPLPQFTAAWIGIDGNSCSSTLLQAGATTTLTGTGSHTSHAWFEWIPDSAYNIPDFPVSPGDWMFINITVKTSTSALMVIENYSASNSITINLNNGYTLCQTDASYIVEDFYTNFGQVPFGDFDDLWFEYCEARRANGISLGIDNAEFLFMQNGWITPSCVAGYYDNENFYTHSQQVT